MWKPFYSIILFLCNNDIATVPIIYRIIFKFLNMPWKGFLYLTHFIILIIPPTPFPQSLLQSSQIVLPISFFFFFVCALLCTGMLPYIVLAAWIFSLPLFFLIDPFFKTQVKHYLPCSLINYWGRGNCSHFWAQKVLYSTFETTIITLHFIYSGIFVTH